MALEIKGMTRSFKFKKGTEYITLHDPDPNISPDMVMSYYSNMYRTDDGYRSRTGHQGGHDRI